MCYLLSSACSQSCKACKLIQFVEYDCYSTTRGIFFQPQSIILIHVGEILVCFSLQQKMGREVFHQHTWPLYSEMAYHLMAQFISDSEWFLQYTHKLEFFFFKEHYFFPPLWLAWELIYCIVGLVFGQTYKLQFYMKMSSSIMFSV